MCNSLSTLKSQYNDARNLTYENNFFFIKANNLIWTDIIENPPAIPVNNLLLLLDSLIFACCIAQSANITKAPVIESFL